MAKAKGKRPRKKTRKLADRIAARKKFEKPAEVNPFELRINRQKHQVVGQKGKNDKGLPGVARAKAETKRKATLLQEYKRRNKTNVLLDRRIGENDPTMSLEEKMSARFTVERQIAEEKKMIKSKSKKDLFNLNDEEDQLTHYGQSLAEIEKFDDPRQDDDDDEDDEKVAMDLMNETNFSGLLSKKEKTDGHDGDVEEKPKSKKERIEEIIASSKQKKFTKQMEKEEQYNQIEKLDAEWKDLTSLMSTRKKNPSVPEPPADPYDILVRSLKFEARGKPTDRLKTPEELAKDEKEKLEKLEAERLRRMVETENDEESPEDGYVAPQRSKHISADDLGDDFDFTPNSPPPVRKVKGTMPVEKEISYTFSVPNTFEEFLSLIAKYSADEQAIVVERIIKCNHQSLAEGNKQKLEAFFGVLLQHFDNELTKTQPNLVVLGQLIPYLYDLSQLSPQSASDYVLKRIIEKQELYRQQSIQCLSGMWSSFPNLDTLMLFKIIAVLFPTSDFRHKVVTPAMLFMGQILSQSCIKSKRDVMSGLFVCSLFLEYVSLSKRLVPEVLHFLQGLLSTALDIDEGKKRDKKFQSKPLLLKLVSTCTDTRNIQLLLRLKVNDLSCCKAGEGEEEISDDFRLNVIWMSCKLLKEFAILYEPLPSFQALFMPSLVVVQKLPVSSYPPEVEGAVLAFSDWLVSLKKSSVSHPLAPLMREKRRPQSITFLEPKIEADFTGRKHKKSGGCQGSETERLKHIVKRETKGALRELRKDNQFLARHQLEEQMEQDATRKRKVKELFAMLSGQEGEHNLMMKKKRKRK